MRVLAIGAHVCASVVFGDIHGQFYDLMRLVDEVDLARLEGTVVVTTATAREVDTSDGKRSIGCMIYTVSLCASVRFTTWMLCHAADDVKLVFLGDYVGTNHLASSL